MVISCHHSGGSNALTGIECSGPTKWMFGGNLPGNSKAVVVDIMWRYLDIALSWKLFLDKGGRPSFSRSIFREGVTAEKKKKSAITCCSRFKVRPMKVFAGWAPLPRGGDSGLRVRREFMPRLAQTGPPRS